MHDLRNIRTLADWRSRNHIIDAHPWAGLSDSIGPLIRFPYRNWMLAARYWVETYIALGGHLGERSTCGWVQEASSKPACIAYASFMFNIKTSFGSEMEEEEFFARGGEQLLLIGNYKVLSLLMKGINRQSMELIFGLANVSSPWKLAKMTSAKFVAHILASDPEITEARLEAILPDIADFNNIEELHPGLLQKKIGRAIYSFYAIRQLYTSIDYFFWHENTPHRVYNVRLKENFTARNIGDYLAICVAGLYFVWPANKSFADHAEAKTLREAIERLRNRALHGRIVGHENIPVSFRMVRYRFGYCLAGSWQWLQQQGLFFIADQIQPYVSWAEVPDEIMDTVHIFADRSRFGDRLGDGQ